MRVSRVARANRILQFEESFLQSIVRVDVSHLNNGTGSVNETIALSFWPKTPLTGELP